MIVISPTKRTGFSQDLYLTWEMLESAEKTQALSELMTVIEPI